MTKREIAALACRILSIYTITIALASLQGFFGFLSLVLNPSNGSSNNSFDMKWLVISTFTPFMLQTTFAVLLWILADGLANVMVQDTEAATAPSNLRSSDLQIVAFSIVGLLTLAQAIPSLAQAAVNYFVAAQPRTPRMATDQGQIIAAAIRLLIGLFLLFGARGMVGLLRSARDVGREWPADEAPTTPAEPPHTPPL